jgi:hypothetical protein
MKEERCVGKLQTTVDLTGSASTFDIFSSD